MKISSKYMVFISCLILLACRKELNNENTPPMEYFNLNNVELKYMSDDVIIDFNKDNQPDLLFYVTKYRDVTDNMDKFDFNIVTSFTTYLPVNRHEQVPAFRKDITIPLNNFKGYTWKSRSEITLMEKLIGNDGSVTWIGNWLAANHHYIPIQISENDTQRFSGWIEVSSDAKADRLIIHRAAICKKANIDLVAGA